jgi:hypothetical protein
VINTDDSLWFMLADNSPFLAGINEEAARASLTKLGTTYVSMNITDSLAVDAGTHLGSPAQVAQMISTIQSWLSKPELAFVTHNYLDQLDVMPDGSDLIVSMAMSGEQLGQLITESPTSDDVDVTDAD